MTLEKDLAIAESNLRTAQETLAYVKTMSEREYVSDLEVERKEFAVKQAELNVEVKQTEIEVLRRFTKEMELETLKGDLNSAKANMAAAVERAEMDATRRDLALEELELCIIRAEKGGLVIHPSAAQWHTAPEIEEGSTVHKDQVLLLMPDLTQMQVKMGVHEYVVDRIKPGLAATVTLPDKTLDGEVDTVASVARPAGIWSGNQVIYDTIIKLAPVKGLMPGMSAEVEVIIERYEEVLTIPVAAVVETDQGSLCWVKTADGIRRRSLKLGDTNDIYTIVEAGLAEGDEVMLNPLPFAEEEQIQVRKSRDEAKQPESPGPDAKPKPQELESGKTPEFGKKPAGKKPDNSGKTKRTKPKKTKPKAA
jgi:multidrug efflux pump subunit AcrA (membrane-fusion protein)